MTAVVAELTADRSRIIIIGTGPTEEQAYAARVLHSLTPAFGKTKPEGALWVPATWSAAVQLGNAFGPRWRPGPALTGWIREQASMRTQIDLTAPLSVAPPAGKVPRPYQVSGAHIIAATGRTLLADEPRTGKTMTTILGLVERWARHGGVVPILAVVPASVVDPWVQAFRDWAPHWRTIAWRGLPKKRNPLLGTAHVYVTSYDLARIGAVTADGILVKVLRPVTLIADEIHMISDPEAQRSRAVTRLAKQAASFVGLSGTPIKSRTDDLFPTVVCLQPGANPSKERWVKRYCATDTFDYKTVVVGLNPNTETEFHTGMLSQFRRVARADVFDQLPPKVYSIRTVEMPAGYRKAYDDLEGKMLAELPDGQELSVLDVLSQLSCLSMLSCAAADVEYTFTTDENTGLEKRHIHIELKAPSWKVEALLEVLDERRGEQVAVFAESAQLIRLAGTAAANAGYKVGYVIGGQTPKARTADIEAFQARRLDVLCCTTKAGGVGITLSSAGTLVFLQRPWSLVESIQAEDRAEAPGKTRGTEIIDILTTNTIDTRKRGALKDKAGQLSEFLKDPRIVAELLGGASVTRIKAAS